MFFQRFPVPREWLEFASHCHLNRTLKCSHQATSSSQTRLTWNYGGGRFLPVLMAFNGVLRAHSGCILLHFRGKSLDVNLHTTIDETLQMSAKFNAAPVRQASPANRHHRRPRKRAQAVRHTVNTFAREFDCCEQTCQSASDSLERLACGQH